MAGSSERRPIIAIDGPAGAGKSSVAQAVARRLGLTYIDTGAMYRAVALHALRQGVAVDDGLALEQLAAALQMEFRRTNGEQHLSVNGEDVESAVRDPQVGAASSPVSAVPGVRHHLTAAQQAMGRDGGVVMEGRDIGTVVFPDAEVKVFLTASPAERARRRYEQWRAEGRQDVPPVEQIEREIAERDLRDSTRADAPLRRAADAVELQTDGMTKDEVVQAIVDLARCRARALHRAGGGGGRSPRPTARVMWLFLLGRWICRTVFRLCGRYTAIGEASIPTSGGVVMAPNHISFLDPPAVGAAMRRPTHFVAKKELFVPIFGPLISRVGAFPIDREGSDRQAIKHAIRLLRSGEAVVLFPEGGRSPDGSLQTGGLGVALVANRAGVPIVPVGVIGTDKVLPRGAKRLRWGDITIIYGQPISSAGPPEGKATKADLQELTDRVMAAIAGLLAQHRTGAPSP